MRNLIVIVVLAVTAAACARPSVPTPTPSPAPSWTPTASPTETPAIPTIGVDGTEVPDPTVSNPELFDLTTAESPIPQFVSAMKMVSVEVDGQVVTQFFADPASFDSRTGIDGQAYVLGSFMAMDEVGTPYALKFIYDEEGGWRSFRFKDSKPTHGIIFGTRLSNRDIPTTFGTQDASRIDQLVVDNYSHAIIEHLNWTETERTPRIVHVR